MEGVDAMYHIHSDKRVNQSVESIGKALHQLIAATPYRQISVTALAKEAGVSKATFYRSFDTIDDVLRYETDQAVEQMIAYMMDQRALRQATGEMGFFHAFFLFWTAHSQAAEVLMATGTTSLLTDAFARALHRNMEFFRRHIHIDDKAAPYFIATRAATLSAVLVCWLEEKPRTHPDEMPAIMAQLIRPQGYPLCPTHL